MRVWLIPFLALVALGLPAQEVVLVSTLSDRPLFNLVTDRLVQTRTVAPQNRITVSESLFSGLGEKEVPLRSGNVYYLARFDTLPHVYRLGSDQALILNQSGRTLSVNLNRGSAQGPIADAGFALLANGTDGTMHVSWQTDEGEQVLTLQAGKVYRWTLVGKETPGASVGLTLWD